MPEIGMDDAARLSKEYQDWVCSISTQAHVKAVSPGEAPALAYSDAAASLTGGTPPQLAKLKGDLTRVEGTLPRSALKDDWQAERWLKVPHQSPALLEALSAVQAIDA